MIRVSKRRAAMDKHNSAEVSAAPEAPDETEAPTASEHAYRGVTRRSLILGIGGIVTLGLLGGIRFAGAPPLVRPPGGQDYDRLIVGCICCEKCVEVCPQQVIKPAHIEDGIVGMRSPVLRFKSSYCDWCNEGGDGIPLCVEVCPTEALTLPQNATAETTLLGLAELNTETCLAFRDNGCRFCYDACPYSAMELDEHNRPSVLVEHCNGCGACESVCVSLENGSVSSSGIFERAIVVRALDSDGTIVNAAEAGGGTL